MVRARSFFALAGLLAAAAACNSAPEPGLSRGEALFDTCVPCHGADGGGNEVLGAPVIAGLPQWYLEESLMKYENGWRGAHPMDTVGLRMRSMANALDLEGDRASIAEFVASLPRPTVEMTLESGDAQAGQVTFQTCIACHGPEGMGVEPVHAPPLVGQADWYLLRQLRNFKTGWRGVNTNDTWGQTMRPNSLLLDDAAMENVVAYIRTLQ